MQLKPACILLAFAALAGCTQPRVNLNPPQTQYRIDYAQHWQLAAERTVDTLVNQVENFRATANKGKPIVPRPYFVHTAAADSPFSKTFTPLLQHELRKRGYTVSRRPQNSLVVNYSVETFFYGASGQQKRLVDYASFWTTAAVLGYVASTSTTAAIGTAIGSAAIYDILKDMGRVTKGEAVLMTSVLSEDHIIHGSSETFYVLPANLPFYWSRYPATAPIETGPPQTVTQLVRTFRVQSM